MSKKYLYGASVQGIQSFIMKTNELKPIIGASELVDQICTCMFDEFTDHCQKNVEIIVRAAGNIKVIFHKKDDCDKAFLEFPRKVMSAAPSITISQAVVCFDDNDDNAYAYAIDILEKRLREERNQPLRPLFPGVIGMERTPKTGEPAVNMVKIGDQTDLIDFSTYKKLSVLKMEGNYKHDYRNLINKAFGDEVGKRLIENDGLIIDNNVLADGNGWLAVVHADGNGFGKIVQELGHDRELFPKLSQTIDSCTQRAFQKAFEEVFAKEGEPYHIRPLVLSGDDVTFICRGDKAIPFVKSFLYYFEKETKSHLSELAQHAQDKHRTLLSSGLTACAGIAFMKPSYPFHYAYNLAENLCMAAKKDSKKITSAPSCLMFYKIQDSIISDWNDMAARELNCSNGSFLFGPYYLNVQSDINLKSRWTIKKLLQKADVLHKNNFIKTSLRKWVSAMYSNSSKAEQMITRFCLVHPEYEKEFNEMTLQKTGLSPAYDILTLSVISKVKSEKQ